MGPRRQLILSAASVVTFLVLWQVLAANFIPPFFLPTPLAIGGAILDLLRQGILLGAIGASLGRIFAGWLLGSLIAVPIGLVVGTSQAMRSIFDPYIHFFRFVPAIALISLFIVWFGIGEASKVLLITYATGFIVMINTATGVTAIPRDKVDAARCLGAGRSQVFLRVVIPATLPFIYTGMRLAMASSFLVIVAAEMLAANSGLGYLIWTSRLYFQIDWMFAAIIILGALGFLADRGWRLFGRLAMKRFLRDALKY